MAEVYTSENVEQNLLDKYREKTSNPTATADDMYNGVMVKDAAFVSPTAMTIAQLFANYPATSGNVGKYARVSNLWGSVDEIVRCRYDGANYRWVPQRETFNMVTSTSGTVNLTPLVTPPMVRTPGNLTGNITYALSATNAYIGQRFRVIVDGLLGVYTATITGAVGSNITLLGKSAKELEYTSDGWTSITT